MLTIHGRVREAKPAGQLGSEAFTIIELLMVIAVFGILAVMFFRATARTVQPPAATGPISYHRRRTAVTGGTFGSNSNYTLSVTNHGRGDKQVYILQVP